MSLAARMKLRKITALQEASRATAVQKEQAEAAQKEKRDSRVNMPFDHPNAATEAPAVTVQSNSPAALLKQEKLARLAIERDGAQGLAPERSADGEGASEYELLLASLGEDEAMLKTIASTERKEEAKRGLIDKYTAHVDATLAAAVETGKGVQDEIVAMMMIWRFDIGDWSRGLDIAEHMLRHGLRLPSLKNFVRSPATIICENVAEAGLKTASADKDFDLAALQRASQLTADYDMPDQVRAKMEKALALHLIRAAEKADKNPDNAIAGAAHAARSQALDHLRRALALNKAIGGVKQVEKLENWLKKNASPETVTETDETSSETDESKE
ncbi:MAG: terminase [Sphingobium sp.]|nr:terminase [Sphingobium sp.]